MLFHIASSRLYQTTVQSTHWLCRQSSRLSRHQQTQPSLPQCTASHTVRRSAPFKLTGPHSPLTSRHLICRVHVHGGRLCFNFWTGTLGGVTRVFRYLASTRNLWLQSSEVLHTFVRSTEVDGIMVEDRHNARPYGQGWTLTSRHASAFPLNKS